MHFLNKIDAAWVLLPYSVKLMSALSHPSHALPEGDIEEKSIVAGNIF